MRVSGNEPSSVIVSPKSSLKVENSCLKVPKQAEAKRDGIINQQNYNWILIGKIWCSQNPTNQPKSTVEHDYICPRGLTSPPAVTLIKKLKYNKSHLLRCIHHFKSDLIKNMDYMHILGNEPSSMILGQKVV